ncbi:DAR GTPase 2, mitochondrial-like protein [Drosera capensis]
MPTASFARLVGSAVQRAALSKQSTWHTLFMAAATRAVAERVGMVDFVVEVRDARTGTTLLQEWIQHFERDNCVTYAINSHNKDDIQEFLNFLQRQVRELCKAEVEKHTVTMMLVGIPNVGKSALANSLHLIGRISAAEKGKLKHAVVSPLPGETKTISSLKIASQPNIYILDTPGILPPQVIDIEVCAKLALTGALSDCLAGEEELAQYFLAILNSNFEDKKWENLHNNLNRGSSAVKQQGHLLHSESVTKGKWQYPTDHTQVELINYMFFKGFIVHDVRRRLSETISSFEGNLEDVSEMERLINEQFSSLREAFGLHISSQKDGNRKVAAKLLNLYRTGRLGYLIPKGWKVLAWIRTVHHDPEVYAESLQFNPSRCRLSYRIL